MIQPLVTIAIPAYKREFIAETVASALSQTYDNIEIIVVDDASPNNIEAEICPNKDKRLTYYKNAANLGSGDPSANWNQCLQMAKGEYICILCDDDLYTKDFIAELVALAEKYPLCNAFRCGVTEVDSNGKPTDLYPLAPEYENVEEYIWHLHSGNNRQTMSEWMIRKQALLDIGGYVSCPMAWGADCATIFNVSVKGGIVTSPYRMMSFRKSDKNITGQESRYVLEKVIGWRKQCDIAGTILSSSRSIYKGIIIGVVEKDKRRWTKTLIKQASTRSLCLMMQDKEQYGITTGMFLNGLWRNFMRFLHIR